MGSLTLRKGDRHLHVAGHVMSWGVAEAPFRNERESGDRCVVQPSREGVLIATVDGTGHGPEAAAAAEIAATTLKRYAQESPIALVLRCHEALKPTRGAVMTLAFVRFRDRTLTWLGVGNVDAFLFHAAGRNITPPDRALLGAGMIGYRLPALRPAVRPLNPLDTLIMATDGIKPGFDEGLTLEGEPQRVADGILARHHSGLDDALVLVARYLGGDCERSPA